MTVFSLVHGLRHPDFVSRDVSGMICHLTDGLTAKITMILVVVASTSVVLVEAITAVLLFKNWKTLRNKGSRTNHNMPVSLAWRIFLFGLLPLSALGLIALFNSTSSNTPKGSSRANILLASLSGTAGVIFGSQEDTLKSWMFWKKSPGTSSLKECSCSLESCARGRSTSVQGSVASIVVRPPPSFSV